MAGTVALYTTALEKALRGQIDIDTDSFRLVLLESAHTPNQTAHSTFSDISANEVSGTGYTAGGEAVTVTVARSGLEVSIDVSDVSWSNATITAGYAAVVRDANGDGSLAGTDDLLGIVDIAVGSEISSTNGTFAVNQDAAGFYTITLAALAEV